MFRIIIYVLVHVMHIVAAHLQPWSQAAGASFRRDFWLIVCYIYRTLPTCLHQQYKLLHAVALTVLVDYTFFFEVNNQVDFHTS